MWRQVALWQVTNFFYALVSRPYMVDSADSLSFFRRQSHLLTCAFRFASHCLCYKDEAPSRIDITSKNRLLSRSIYAWLASVRISTSGYTWNLSSWWSRHLYTYSYLYIVQAIWHFLFIIFLVVKGSSWSLILGQLWVDALDGRTGTLSEESAGGPVGGNSCFNCWITGPFSSNSYAIDKFLNSNTIFQWLCDKGASRIIVPRTWLRAGTHKQSEDRLVLMNDTPNSWKCKSMDPKTSS